MMAVLKGNKKTELGEIPIEWEIKTFKDVVESGPQNGLYKGKEFYARGKCKIVQLKDLYRTRKYLDCENLTFIELEEKELQLYNLQQNDLLINRVSIAPSGIGRFMIVPCEDKICFESNMMRIKVNNAVIDAEFLFYLSESRCIRKQLISKAKVSNQASISQGDLASLIFPLPSMNEQKEIAYILSTIDNQIENINQLTTKTKELKKGLMQQLLTRGIGDNKFKHTEIGEIPIHWETKMLGDIVCKITDGAHKTPQYTDKGIPFLRVVDIQKNYIDWDKTKYISLEEHKELIKRCHPEKGDILISKNGTIGITKLIDWEEEFSIFVSLCLIKLNKENSLVLPDFLVYFFESIVCQKQFKNSSKQGTVTNLHLVEIRKLIIPLPSIEEQQKIAETLSSVDEQIDIYEQEKEKYIELKKGLMQQLFTGKLRVTV